MKIPVKALAGAIAVILLVAFGGLFVINFTDMALGLAHVASLITNHTPLVAGCIGLTVGWLICPGYMYAIAYAQTGKWLEYDKQFKAFVPGNFYLGLVFGLSCYLYASINQANTPSMFHLPQWAYWALGGAALVVAALGAIDGAGAITYNRGHIDKNGRIFKYHWRQLLDWTKLWHNIFVYGVYGFLLIYVGAPGVALAPWVINHDPFLAVLPYILPRAVMLGCLGAWVRLLAVDMKYPMHATGHIAVTFVQWMRGLGFLAATTVVVVALFTIF